MVKELLANGADPNKIAKNKITPFLLLCGLDSTPNQLDLLTQLLERGANPLLRTGTNQNGIHLASRKGNLAVVQFLIQVCFSFFNFLSSLLLKIEKCSPV